LNGYALSPGLEALDISGSNLVQAFFAKHLKEAPTKRALLLADRAGPVVA
jgi:hypothetical protein